MKKSILSIIAVIIVFVFAFASCEKEKTMTELLQQEKEKIMTELLQQEKGWVMSAATTTPYWTLSDSIGTQITDLLNSGYIFDCEKDDILTFKSDGYEYLNPGKNVCEGDPAQETSLGKWTLDEKAKTLEMQLPCFGDDAIETVKVEELTSSTLKLSYTFTLEQDPAKVVPGTYTFTFTYVPAK